MKKILYILLSAAMIAFVGCDKQDIDIDTNGGKGLTFVHFDQTAVSAVLAADDASYTYTVDLKITETSTEDRSFDIVVDESSTGKEGTDFTLASKTIVIPAGKYSGSTTFTCNYAKVGKDGFVLKLNVDVPANMLSNLYGNSVIYTFKTDKITIDWAWFAGKWSGDDYDYTGAYEDGGWEVAITKDPDNAPNGFLITGLWGTDQPLKGTVDFDNRTLSITPGKIWTYGNYGDFFAIYLDMATLSADETMTTPITGTLSPKGVQIGPWAVLCGGELYGAYVYEMLTK